MALLRHGVRDSEANVDQCHRKASIESRFSNPNRVSAISSSNIGATQIFLLRIIPRMASFSTRSLFRVNSVASQCRLMSTVRFATYSFFKREGCLSISVSAPRFANKGSYTSLDFTGLMKVELTKKTAEGTYDWAGKEAFHAKPLELVAIAEGRQTSLVREPRMLCHVVYLGSACVHYV